MESEKCTRNPHDEVRKLQDKVRKLELQNERLRSQQFSRNGLLENRPNVLSYASDGDYYKKRYDLSSQLLDDNYLTPEEMDNEEFLNEETWLNKARGSVVDNTTHDLIQWLRQDVDNHNNYEMQRIRRVLIQRIDEIEQGLRRSSIDTRTFTRPKKRMSRPSLETMSESPMLDSKLSLSPWQRLLATHAITENIDDFSFKFDNTFPSLSSDLPNLNATFNKTHNMGLNTTYQKIASENRLSMASDSKFDVTFLKTDLEIQELNTSQKSSDSDLSTSSRKASDPCLNTTFLKAPGEIIASHQMSPRSRSITPSGLNCTFSVADNSGHRSGRALSCDSMADDDQMSSASDSSFSSTTRLMNVGDVQNIARLQEESLKQVTSTPKRSNNRDGLTLGNGDDGLSPIKRSMQDLNHGYQSDHSDHSSAEGRVRSARSSVRSSPAGSPFGSTNALSHDCPPPSNSTVGLPRRELKLVPPSQKQPVPKPQGALRPAESTRGRPASGLRPPATRPSGIGRPSSAGASNIPRPQSRIPAPRFRNLKALYAGVETKEDFIKISSRFQIPKSAYSAQPTTKVDWMDGCY